MKPLRLSAGWVLPIAAPPMRHGAVLVGDDGRIVSAGPESEVARPAAADCIDLGEAALLPGLVNAHSHLELTALRGLVRDLPFPEWIGAVRRIKEALDADDFRASARRGVLEAFASGITTLGDAGSSGQAAGAMAALGARGIAFLEVFGPDPAQADAAVESLRSRLQELSDCESRALRLGVSPHAPYTVSGELLSSVASLARATGRSLSMHVGESWEESALVRDGRGPFADALRGRGIRVEGQGRSPFGWVLASGLHGVHALFVHCVTADAGDAALLARAGISVAHCPRSNSDLGHGRMDLAGLRLAGVQVGLGTDSVATGGVTDLFAEARAAADGTAMDAASMLRLATVESARALGVGGAGTIEEGAWGDVVAVEIEGGAPESAAEVEEALASRAGPGSVLATWVAGRCVYEGGTWPGVDADAERSALDRATARAVAARASN